MISLPGSLLGNSLPPSALDHLGPRLSGRVLPVFPAPVPVQYSSQDRRVLDPLLDPVSPFSFPSRSALRLPFSSLISFQHSDFSLCQITELFSLMATFSDYLSFGFRRPPDITVCFRQHQFLFDCAFSASFLFALLGWWLWVRFALSHLRVVVSRSPRIAESDSIQSRIDSD